MYNIDEENSDVTFVVEDDKVRLKIKNYDTSGSEIPYVIGSGEATAESETNVYSAQRMKGTLAVLDGSSTGCTASARMNEWVRELYLTGLDSSKFYFVSQLWNNGGYLQFRISQSLTADLSSPVVILQIYTNTLTAGGLYRLVPQGDTAVRGMVRLQVDFAALPTTVLSYMALVHQNIAGSLHNAPSIEAAFARCVCSEKGFVSSPSLVAADAVSQLNQLQAVQRLTFWHVAKFFPDGVVYFRGILVVSGAIYLQFYDTAGNVHTLTLDSRLPAGGCVTYRGERTVYVTDAGGHSVESYTGYLYLALNYDLYDAKQASAVYGVQVENHLLHDARWCMLFADETRRNAMQALEMAGRLVHDTGVVYDENRLPYRLSIEAGAIRALPIVYKNVLVLGNSITVHGRLPERGWYGGSFGMAASRASTVVGQSTDYVSHLKNGLALRYPNLFLSRVNMAKWETTLELNNFIADMSGIAITGRDVIIVRLCENVPQGLMDSFYGALDRVVKYVVSQNGTAQIYLCGSCMTSEKSRAAGQIVQRYAVEHHLPYVDVQCEYEELERLGHYTEGFTDDSRTTTALYPITDGGVAGHPGDLGHLHIANRLLDALHYPMLYLEHAITVVNNSSLAVDAPASWVERGIFNIKTAATVVTASYRDAAGNSEPLALTAHDGGLYTAVMPAGEVEIAVG